MTSSDAFKESAFNEKHSCESKILFIGIDNPFYLPPMIPYIERLSQIIPSDALDFELIPVISPEFVDLEVDKLEKLVTQYYQRGYRYIGLPDQSTLIRPFLLGTGGSLNNIPIDRRWPDVNFMVQGPTIGAVDLMYNVYRFYDINTLENRNLLRFNIDQFVKNTGRAYVIFQGAGDAYSSVLTNIITEVALGMGLTTDIFEVGTPDNDFDMEALEEVVDFIKETAPPPPAQSVIIIAVNGLLSEKFTQAGIESGLFSDFNGRVVHYNYGFDYEPEDTLLPVPLYYGRIPVEGIPSLEAASIGIPINPEEYYEFPYLLTYLDAYLWAATCGRTDGINDKQLKFDKSGTRIAYYLADYHIPPNSLIMQLGPYYFNPRWFDSEASVVPPGV